MCSTQIRKFNGDYYFVAQNIIRTDGLPDELRKTSELGWNSLCLCPNCAARYVNCSKSLTGLIEQILQAEAIDGDSEKIILTIELDGKVQEIRYVPKHFLALQTVIKLIQESEEKQHNKDV